jgi:hypothetical protein
MNIVTTIIPGKANTTLMSCAARLGPKSPCAPKISRKTSPTTTGENGKRQVDQRNQQTLAAEVELGNCPRRGDTEEQTFRAAR